MGGNDNENCYTIHVADLTYTTWGAGGCISGLRMQ